MKRAYLIPESYRPRYRGRARRIITPLILDGNRVRGTGGRGDGRGQGGAKKREERGEKGETHAAGRHVRMCPDQ